MFSVIQISNEILRISMLKGIPLTPLKLMKLTYISFGFYIANFDQRLFIERIEAWKLGPVIPVLYQHTKEWGKGFIPYSMELSDTSILSDENSTKLIENVVDNYGMYDGLFLSSLTHKEGTPWHQVYNNWQRGIEIPDHIISKYYKEFLNVARSSSKTDN